MILDDYTGFLATGPVVLYDCGDRILVSSCNLDRIHVLLVRPTDVQAVELVLSAAVSPAGLPEMRTPGVLVLDGTSGLLAKQSVADDGTATLGGFEPVTASGGLADRMAALPECPMTAADWLDVTRTEVQR